MPKLSSGLSGVHDIHSLETLGKRSIPHSAKSAFLALFMHQNYRDRLIVEKERLERQGKRISQKLLANKKEIEQLLEVALGQEKNNPGPEFREKITATAGSRLGGKNKKTVISY